MCGLYSNTVCLIAVPLQSTLMNDIGNTIHPIQLQLWRQEGILVCYGFLSSLQVKYNLQKHVLGHSTILIYNRSINVSYFLVFGYLSTVCIPIQCIQLLLYSYKLFFFHHYTDLDKVPPLESLLHNIIQLNLSCLLYSP